MDSSTYSFKKTNPSYSYSTCVFNNAAVTYMRGAHQQEYDEGEVDKSSHLEGATPTKFGPKPLKSERGPSFSSINLINKHIH